MHTYYKWIILTDQMILFFAVMVIYCINNNLLLNVISVEGTLFVNDTNGLVLSYETTTASVQTCYS